MNQSSVRRQIPRLSKSSFNAGLQCLKRLYLESFHRELIPPVDEARQAVFDAGTRVGELARDLYPGGTLMEQDHLHINEAIAATRAVLAGPSVPAVYEAGFIFDDVRVRVDILPRASGGRHDLVEVKSTTSVKEEHIPDVAIQLYVLEGSGVKPRRACLAHLNKNYSYPGGDYDVHQLFAIEDVSEQVRGYLPGIPEILKSMRQALRGSEPPDIRPGRQCTSPHECPFIDYCSEGGTEHPVGQLPKASQKLLSLLKERGIEDIREIDPGFAGLNEMQRRVRDCVVNNRVYLNPAIRRELERLVYPVHFLDFESFNPALPLYVGTHPYQVIPFQWSDHILGPDGKLSHREFLHEDSGDPREPLARSLLKTLGKTGSIVVYSKFEETRIGELAEALPHLSRDLLALLDGRIVDLLPLVRGNCYHPGFHGSFSLKAVLPALVTDLGYDDLDITDGQAASLAYAEIIGPETPDDRRQELRADLLLYCGRDTEAMVRLVETLRAG
jgi:CRISPR/Cas system-associated exonuclease Cas4 (RecB family)